MAAVLSVTLRPNADRSGACRSRRWKPRFPLARVDAAAQPRYQLERLSALQNAIREFGDVMASAEVAARLE